MDINNEHAQKNNEDPDLEEFDQMMQKVVQARFEAKQRIEPSPVFTAEELAEMLDEVKAMLGENTTVKTDPKIFRERRTPESRAETDELFRQLEASERKRE